LFYGIQSNCSYSQFYVVLFFYYIAAHASNIPCIKLLLELGADPSIPDNDGQLPSSIAQTDEEKAVWIEH